MRLIPSRKPKGVANSDLTKTLATLGFYINLGRFLHICPYRFDAKAGKMVTEKGRRYRIGAFIGLVLVLFYDVFLIAQLIRLQFDNDVPFSYRMRTYYLSTTILFWSTGVPLALRQYGSYAALFNGLMEMRREIAERQEVKQEFKAMKWVLRAIVFLYLFGAITIPRDLVKRPDMPLLLTSVLDKNSSAWRKWMLPIWALHSYFLCVSFYNSFLTTMLLLLFVSTVTPTVQSLSTDKGVTATDESALRRIFGRLAVLERAYTSTLAPWTLQLVVTHVLYVILCIYQWFLTRSPVAAVGGVIIFATLANFSRKCGSLYEGSAEVRRSWTTLERNDAAFRKWRRACRPLRVTIGAFFYFDRQVLMTLVEIIVENSVSLILSK